MTFTMLPIPSRSSAFRFPLHTALLALGLVSAGCGKKPAAAGGPPMGGTPEVSVLTLEARPVTLTTELTGRVSASQVAEVRPQVSGIILQRHFTEGGTVQAGELLYQIDPAPYQAAHDSAAAALAKAEANLDPVSRRAARFRELMASEAVSQQDLDDAEAALKLTQAEIAAARAALENAKIQLAYTKVSAPIGGRIGRSAVTQGALVTANQAAALAVIQQLDPVYVDLTQSSAERALMRKQWESGGIKAPDAAAAVELTLDDGSRHSETGTLKFSEAMVEPSTGTVTLRTLFPNAREVLLPGMFVRATIQEGTRENAILVPQRAVTRNPAGKAMVYAVSPQDTLELRLIETNRTVGDQWLVTGGLEPGVRVIIEGQQKVQRIPPGTPVKAVPFTAAANGSSPAPQH
jgi:membrane fusion protein (multidrug efflux system)